MKELLANYVADIAFRMLFTVGGLAFPLEQGTDWWKRNNGIPIWKRYTPPKEDPNTGTLTLASLRKPEWFIKEPWNRT